MKLEWDLHVPVSQTILDVMTRAAQEVQPAEGIPVACAASVILCDDEMIAALNSSHRGIDRSTDVLSFPTISYPDGKTAGLCLHLLKREYDDGLNACYLGDIIISVPRLYAQAEEYGHAPEREAAYLLIHGLCHLMGYDHITEEERQKMREMEEKILSAASAGRNMLSESDLDLLQMAREAMKNSYSPFSKFPVGAALRTKDGKIFTGCNIENSSFGLTCCAERTAIFKATSEGARQFDCIAIAANEKPWPCGACRQVLHEFAPDLRVIITWGKGETDEKMLYELLPEGFNL